MNPDNTNDVSCPRIFDGKDLYYNLKEKLRKKKSMTTNIQWKLIVSTIFLTLIFSLNVVECCSGGKTTTEQPAEATEAPAYSKKSTMMNDDGTPMMTDAPANTNSSTMMNGNGTMMAYNTTMMAYNSTMMAGSTTEKSLYTPYYNMTYQRKHIQT